jgi:hypothetical protein
MNTITIPARDIRSGDRIVTATRGRRSQVATVMAVAVGTDHVSVTTNDQHGWSQSRFPVAQQITVRRSA